MGGSFDGSSSVGFSVGNGDSEFELYYLGSSMGKEVLSPLGGYSEEMEGLYAEVLVLVVLSAPSSASL